MDMNMKLPYYLLNYIEISFENLKFKNEMFQLEIEKIKIFPFELMNTIQVSVFINKIKIERKDNSIEISYLKSRFVLLENRIEQIETKINLIQVNIKSIDIPKFLNSSKTSNSSSNLLNYLNVDIDLIKIKFLKYKVPVIINLKDVSMNRERYLEVKLKKILVGFEDFTNSNILLLNLLEFYEKEKKFYLNIDSLNVHIYPKWINYLKKLYRDIKLIFIESSTNGNNSRDLPKIELQLNIKVIELDVYMNKEEKIKLYLDNLNVYYNETLKLKSNQIELKTLEKDGPFQDEKIIFLTNGGEIEIHKDLLIKGKSQYVKMRLSSMYYETWNEIKREFLKKQYPISSINNNGQNNNKLDIKLEFQIENIETYLSDHNKLFGFELNECEIDYKLKENNYILKFKKVLTYFKIYENEKIIQYPYVESKKFIFEKKENIRKIFGNHLTFCWSAYTKIKIEELKQSLFTSNSSSNSVIMRNEYEFNNFIYQLKYTNDSILEFHITKLIQNLEGSIFNHFKVYITHEKIFECDDIIYKKIENFKSIFDEYHEGTDKKYLRYLEFDKASVTIPNKTNLGNSWSKYFLSRRVLTKIFKEVTNENIFDYENIIIKFKNFKFELKDNKIEKSLTIHQQLWNKEVKEREERMNLLKSKIKNVNTLLLDELEKQNSQIYFEKLLFFKKNNTIPNELLTLEFTELEVNMRSRSNPIHFIQSFYKNENLSFLTTLYKNISWNIKDIMVQIRNYPNPLLKVNHSMGQGDFLYGKITPTENDTIEKTIYFENESFQVPYYVNPSMLFYNFTGNIQDLNLFVGKAYGPTFSDIELFLDRILPKSLDPSPKKLWWDKIRHRLHGNFEMNVLNLKTKILLGLNNYDPIENLEILIKRLNVNYKESLILDMNDLKFKYHPSLSLFPNIADIPYLEIQISYDWKCKGNEKDPFFKIDLPKEFRTEEGIEKYRNEIQYDSYENWKLILFHLKIGIIFYPKMNDKSSNSNLVVMLDPISLNWLIKFIFFMNHEHWQLHIGKVYKFGMKKIDYNISHFIKSLNIHVKGFNPQIIWSNGVEDNRILHLGLSNFELTFIGERDEMPNLKIPKNQRPRTSYSIHLLKLLFQNLEAHVYEEEEKFGNNFLFSLQKFEFLKGNEKMDVLSEIINEYENKLIIQDFKGLYSASNRDSILIWIDLIDQFLDRDFDKQSFLKRLGNNNEKNNQISKKFIILLINAQLYLSGEKNECFLLKSSNGNIEVVKNASSIEILSLMDNIEIFSLKKEDFMNEKVKLRILMEPSPWIFRFNNESTKMLHVEIPDLEMLFTSKDLKIFQDIISNVIIPKKMVRKVFSEELIQSEIYKNSIQNNDLSEIQEKCEMIRKEIRQLELEMNESQRNFNNIKKIEKELIEKKILYRGLKESIQKKMNEKRKEKRENEIDMITSLIIHNCKWKLLDKNDKVFMEAQFILFQGNITKHHDFSLIFDITLHYFTIKNKLQNPIYEDLLIPFQDNVIDNDDYMLRVYIKKSNAVGGIRIVNHFEIELAPIHLQLTYQAYSLLWAYFFPLVEKQKNDPKLIDSVTTLNSKLELESKNEEKDVNIMKERAKNTMIFNYIHIHKMKFYLSFKGVQNGITQIIRNFDKTKLKLNPIIIHQQTFTWFQLFEALKKNIIKQVLSYIPSTIKSVIENKLKYTIKKKESKKEDKILNHKKLVNEIQKIKQSKTKNMDEIKRIMLFGKKEVKKIDIKDTIDENIDMKSIFDQITQVEKKQEENK